jgi:hypothetical protein
MWKKVVQPDRPQMTIKCSKEKMQFACCVTEARIQPHSHNIQYMLPSYDKNGYANALQCYTYIVCHSYIIFVHDIYRSSAAQQICT